MHGVLISTSLRTSFFYVPLSRSSLPPYLATLLLLLSSLFHCFLHPSPFAFTPPFLSLPFHPSLPSSSPFPFTPPSLLPLPSLSPLPLPPFFLSRPFHPSPSLPSSSPFLFTPPPPALLPLRSLSPLPLLPLPSLSHDQPVRMHNWEVVIHFHVHGSGKNLFGDGFAMWYTKEKGEKG